jgi:NADH:ubiquinone reductase (H+-translocating)
VKPIKNPQCVRVCGGDRRSRRAPAADDICFGWCGPDWRGVGGIDGANGDYDFAQELSAHRSCQDFDNPARGGKRILPSFAESLSKKADKHLAKLGVQVITGSMVEHIDAQGVTVGDKLIPCATVLWTAGVSPSPLVKMLGVATDRAGRACVGPSLNVPDTRGVFVVGDTATLIQNGRPLPGVAQVAIQQGRYVGRLISRELRGRKLPGPFRYFDKGNMAVVGKNFAIMESGRIRLAGFTAWLAWAFIHLRFLPQLQNRRRVRNQWLWSYFTGQRSSRLVSEPPRTV